MSEGRLRETSEIVSAGLMAAATVASAWCAYQAALWSGNQIRNLAKASSAQFESIRKTNEANVFLLVDVETFLRYAEEDARGDHKLAEMTRSYARPEFRPALDDWIAERREGRQSPQLPFSSTRYQLATLEAAQKLTEEAKVANDASNAANGHSDLFVMHTVLFSLALFFLGVSSTSVRSFVRRVMLILGALAFVVGVISMARLPRAPDTPRRPDLQAAHHEGR